MRKSRQFVGMPVISLEEGQQIGTVNGLVVNPALKNVSALIIEQKGFFREQKYIPFSKVHSIGNDAVTVDRVNRAEKGTSLPEILKLIKERANIAGSRLMDENGAVLGVVDEYYVDLQTGDIVGLEFSGGTISNLFKGSAFMDINYVRTIGQSVIICSKHAQDNIVTMDGGINETLRAFGENTGQFLEVTLQKTRVWGQNLNQSLKKLRRNKKRAAGADAPGASPGQTSGTGEPPCPCHHNEEKKAAGTKETEPESPPAEEAPPAEKGRNTDPHVP